VPFAFGDAHEIRRKRRDENAFASPKAKKRELFFKRY
jgi:hypothetical protein